MEALGEEAGWKREDEGGKRWNRLERGRERKDWRRRKEWKIGRKKRSFFIKSCTKKGEI